MARPPRPTGTRRTPELVRRQQALAKTQARFAGKAFKLGSNDCVKLARFHAQMMGHRKLPSTGHYSSPLSAKKALMKTGHRTLKGLLESLFEQIAPAAALPGDLLMPPSDPGAPASEIGTVMVSVGRGKALGWHPDYERLAVMELLRVDHAWRV